MLLTISTTYQPATDLGYLLHKNPSRFQSFDVSFGKVHVFFPAAEHDLCTAALLLDIDPIGLVRKAAGEDQILRQYVNDRPYVASSYLSVAIAQVLGTALSGRCNARPELVGKSIPLVARLTSVPDVKGGLLIRQLFEPLGYLVQIERSPLDERFPEWGESSYFTLELTGCVRLSELLTHLYVLVPVLDDYKHYWVGDAEVEKLLQRGEGWLPNHPKRELITSRYLRFQRSLIQTALDQLMVDETVDTSSDEAAQSEAESFLETPLHLQQQRLDKLVEVLNTSHCKKVIDLGCGEGDLIRSLMKDGQYSRLVGMDVSCRALAKAASRLRLDQLPSIQRDRIELFQGSLLYRDARLEGFDAAIIMEVIEHLDPARLGTMERVVFEFTRPGKVIITTPNFEYNCKFSSMPAGAFRHKDHRFEWTRVEFESWCRKTSERYGYQVEFDSIGPIDEVVGAPCQMGVFS